MRKKTLLIFIFIFILALGLSFSGCDKTKDDGIFPETKYEIDSIDDFLAIREKAGYRYQNAIFSLNTDLDLTDRNWEGFGISADVTEAFSGTLLGNGHTIKYAIEVDPPEDNADAVLREEYGLVKYGNNAHFYNLIVEYIIDVPNEAQKIYIAGVCAYLCGKSSVNNVTVSGKITTTIRDFRKDEVYSDGKPKKPQTDFAENNKFFNVNMGGVLGYAKGDISLKNITSKVDMVVNRNKFCMVDNLNIGGIAGLVRPVDLSKANGNILHHNDLGYDGQIKIYAGNAYVGGIAGAFHHSIIKNVKVGSIDSNVKFEGSALGRLSMGSVAGILENSSLENAICKVGDSMAEAINTGKKVSFNLGGIAGLLKSANISYCDADFLIEVRNGTYYNAGGLAGICYDSEIDKCVSSGGISILSSGQIRKTILEYNFGYTHDKEKIADYFKNSRNGGIVGRIEGQSTLGHLATKFQAYQPIVGEIVERIEIVVLEKGEEALTDWIKKSRYNEELMKIEKSEGKDLKDNEQQYTIINFHKVVDDSKISYLFDGAKVCLDREFWELEDKDYDLNVGIGQNDDTAYLDLKAEIEENN